MTQVKTRFEVRVNGRVYSRTSPRKYTHALVIRRSVEKFRGQIGTEFYKEESFVRDLHNGHFLNHVISWHQGAANAQKAHKTALSCGYYVFATIVEVGQSVQIEGDNS